MVEILQKVKFDVSQVTASSAASEVAKGATVISQQKQAKTKQQAQEKKMVEKKKKRLRKVLTRRRRRRGDKNDSSEEECEVLSSSDYDDSTASDEDTLSMDLSNTLGEDDLEMLEKLSDCSSSEDEGTKDELPSLEKTPPNPSQPLAVGMSPASVQKKAKRQIILAANFSNAPRPKLEEAKTEFELRNTASGSAVPSSHATYLSVKQDPTASVDNSLLYLMEKTGHQSIVYSVCCLVAEEESYLMSLRVFVEWIQSYPIAVASTQVI